MRRAARYSVTASGQRGEVSPAKLIERAALELATALRLRREAKKHLADLAARVKAARLTLNALTRDAAAPAPSGPIEEGRR